MTKLQSEMRKLLDRARDAGLGRECATCGYPRRYAPVIFDLALDGGAGRRVGCDPATVEWELVVPPHCIDCRRPVNHKGVSCVPPWRHGEIESVVLMGWHDPVPLPITDPRVGRSELAQEPPPMKASASLTDEQRAAFDREVLATLDKVGIRYERFRGRGASGG